MWSPVRGSTQERGRPWSYCFTNTSAATAAAVLERPAAGKVGAEVSRWALLIVLRVGRPDSDTALPLSVPSPGYAGDPVVRTTSFSRMQCRFGEGIAANLAFTDARLSLAEELW